MKLLKIVCITVTFAFIAGFTGMINKTGWQMAACIAAGTVSVCLTSFYEFIDTHGQGFKIWFKSRVLYRNTELYLSFAYSYRVVVDGKYLLIRGGRMKDRYQPIGGVYKYYKEAKPFLEKIKCNPDNSVVNNDEDDDLRVTIKGKYLLEFYDWFNSMKDREYDPRREFYEEVIATELLPERIIKNIKYRKFAVHNKGITDPIAPGGKKEVIYADIFELSLTDDQKTLIREAVDKNSELCLATVEEIRMRQYNNSVEMNISNNARWLLNEDDV